MSDENGKNDTRDMLEKIDEQLQKHRQALEKSEQNLRRAQEKIRNCKKSMSDIQRMRSAIIGEKVVALGFDTVQELERLYELARARKEEYHPQRQEMLSEVHAENEHREGTMM